MVSSLSIFWMTILVPDVDISKGFVEVARSKRLAKDVDPVLLPCSFFWVMASTNNLNMSAMAIELGC